MKVWICKKLMNFMAQKGLVRYSIGHKVFNFLYGVRIGSGEWGKYNGQ